MIRLLIAPDSFKRSITARDVAQALESGARSAAAAAGVALEVRCRPLSDGGEGLVDALELALGGERREALVRSVDLGADPAWRTAEWLWIPDSKTAIAEVAQVVGYHVTRVDSPLQRTALGIGDYLTAMRESGARRIIVGIGGTTTVDGGASVMQALGARFEAAAGVLHVATLLDAANAERLTPGPKWSDVEVICWSDVTTPLVGERGAVPLFAPQKGASAEDVERLEAAVDVWGALARRATGADPTAPGTGAGGGIPFGIMAALGARIERGGDNVTELLGLTEDARWADVVWTGEGQVDQTTAEGKLVHQVIALAAQNGASAAVLAGQIADGRALDLGEAGLHALTDTGASVEECLAEPHALLEKLAHQVMTDWLRAQG